MTEEQMNYLPMEQQTRQLEQRLKIINNDPTANYWLKRAASELWERDTHAERPERIAGTAGRKTPIGMYDKQSIAYLNEYP